MPLLFDTGTDTIDLPDGEWVKIKKHFTDADWNKLLSAAYHIKQEIGEQDMRQSADAGTWNDVMLQIAVVDWSYKFPEGHARAGEPVPVKKEFLAILDSPSADKIRARASELNPRRSEAEKKDLVPS